MAKKDLSSDSFWTSELYLLAVYIDNVCTTGEFSFKVQVDKGS